MSTFSTHPLPCRACQRTMDVTLIDSINVARHPAGQQQVLDRTLHRHTCEHCGHVVVYDRPMLYTDLDRGLFIRVEPETLRPRHLEFEPQVIEVHRRVLCDERAPRFVREVYGAQTRPLLVFGYEELREKVLANLHGLDDFLVEALKFELLIGRPELLLNGAMVLLLIDVTEAGELEYAILYDPDHTPIGERVQGLRVAREHYVRMVELRPRLVEQWPQLAAGPWVNIARYRFAAEREDAAIGAEEL